MPEKLKGLPLYFVIAIILTGIVLAGCGTGSAAQPASPSPGPAVPAPPAGAQTDNGTQNGAHSGRAGRPDMSKMMGRAAEILGITEAQLTSAFQQARESVFGAMPGGIPGLQPLPDSSGQRPPYFSTDNSSGQWQHQPPPGTSGQPPPQGGWGSNSETTQKFYIKMAEILSISADRIASAMEQARQELQPAVKQP